MQCLALSSGVFPVFSHSDCSAVWLASTAKPQMQNSLKKSSKGDLPCYYGCLLSLSLPPSLSLSLSLSPSFSLSPSDCSAGWLASTAKPQMQNSPKVTDIPLVTTTKVTVSLVMTVVVFSVLWTSWWKTWQSAQWCPTCKILTKLTVSQTLQHSFCLSSVSHTSKHAFCVSFLCLPNIKITLSVHLFSVSKHLKHTWYITL